jgi:hypothetical protein
LLAQGLHQSQRECAEATPWTLTDSVQATSARKASGLRSELALSLTKGSFLPSFLCSVFRHAGLLAMTKFRILIQRSN